MFPLVLVWRKNYDALKRERDKAREDAERFRNRTKEMQAQIDGLVAENGKALKRAKDAESEAEDNEDSADNAKRQVKRLREENERLTRQLADHRAACDSYEQEIKNLKNK